MATQSTSTGRRSDVEMVRVEVKGARWVAAASEVELLLGEGSPHWFDLSTDERTSLVKRGSGRVVLRVNFAERVVYAKVFETVRGFGLKRLAPIFRLDGASRGWRALRRAEAMGIGVARPLAVGRETGNEKRSVLLTEGVEDARNLRELWSMRRAISSFTERAAARIETSAIIGATARLFASAHAHAFVHSDPHPGNILLAPQSGGGFKAFFVDVQESMGRRRRLSIRRAAMNLAMLDQGMKRWASRTARFRFLRTYLEEWSRIQKDNGKRSNPNSAAMEDMLRGFLRILSEASAVHAAALARQRDRRLRVGGKYFAPIQLAGGWSGTVYLTLERRHVFAEMDTPDRTWEEWRRILEGIVMENSRRSATTPDAECQRISWKILSASGRAEALLWQLTGSPARNTFLRSHRLRHRDLPSLLVLGFLEHRSALGGIDTAIVFFPINGLAEAAGSGEVRS